MKKLFLAALAVVAIASCAKNEVAEIENNDQITFQTVVGPNTKAMINGMAYSNAADFAAAVNGAIAACSFSGKAGTDLSTLDESACIVTWEWPFTTGAENDVKDTYLGNQANDGNAAQIYLEVSCTIEQVD